MPFQNRVDPFGNMIATTARGSWLGNRGVIHNDKKEIVRPFKIKAWITCVLQFRGRHRQIMQHNRWTELFFLDEVTAFAAGHRPCFQCRYADHKRFKDAWLAGNPGYGFDHKTSIKLIDDILHAERTTTQKREISKEEIKDLPDGTFIQIEGEPFLVANNGLHYWTPFGYTIRSGLIVPEKVSVLTPLTIINAFSAGYTPQISFTRPPK